MTENATWCRQCESLCGVITQGDGQKIVSVVSDPQNPISLGSLCPVAEHSVDLMSSEDRILHPQKRVGDAWVQVSWDEAIREIGAQLKAIRQQSGPESVGVHAGPPVAGNTRASLRTVAFTLSMGTPNLFTGLPARGGPILHATELMLGQPIALQSDVARAHHVLLLGGNQEATSWGPLQAGRSHHVHMKHHRTQRKSNRVSVADARFTPIAAAASNHFAIRPGTDLFFVLGMCHAIAKGGWSDQQFIRDHTNGYDALSDVLGPWTPDRCAEICGVSASDISGEALRFSRAAMAVAHRSPQAFGTPRSTLTAWALMVLHGLTANILRPGGLYESIGVLDFGQIASYLGTANAPKTRIGGFPLVLLQAPETVLPNEIVVPGDGRVRALVSVQADAAGTLAPGENVEEALKALDLLVCIDSHPTPTHQFADWILPATMQWERPDSHLQTSPILPARFLQAVEPTVQCPGEARPEDEILADLIQVIKPSLRTGAYGLHLRALGRWMATADLASVEDRLIELFGDIEPEEVRSAEFGLDYGYVNRAEWRLETKDNRFEFAPEPYVEAMHGLKPPHHPPGFDLSLLTSGLRDPAHTARYRPETNDPGATLHPSTGISDGSKIVIETPWGAVKTVARLDETLRPDTVDLPRGYATPVHHIVPNAELDPFVGTAWTDGLPCRITLD